MEEVIADQNYYFDADGNVTTDEAKGERWLARKGAVVLDEHQDALSDFQNMAGEYGTGKVAQEDEADSTVEKKADKASSNKKATPSKNKGAK